MPISESTLGMAAAGIGVVATFAYIYLLKRGVDTLEDIKSAL